MNIMDTSGLTINRDNGAQITVSGTYLGQSLWQQIMLNIFPVLIAFDVTSNNFLSVTDISQLDSNNVIMDIYYE